MTDFPSATAFFEPVLWALGHHSRAEVLGSDDDFGGYGFPPTFEDFLRARSSGMTGAIRMQNGQKVRVTKLKVARPYFPVSLSDSLCRQILVIGGLLARAKTTQIDRLPRGWRLDSAKPSGEKIGLYRVVGFAFRNQRLGYCNGRTEMTWHPVIWAEGQAPTEPRLRVDGGVTHVEPSYVRELHRTGSPLVKHLRPLPGCWMLTEEGAMRAQAIIDERGVPGYNLTAQWIEQNVGAAELDWLYRDLGRRLPKSRHFDLVQGQVHNKLLKLCELDSFAGYLAQGETPKLSQIANFCFRQAVSDLAADAREPTSRALQNSRSKAEYRGAHLAVQSPTPGRLSQNLSKDIYKNDDLEFDLVDTQPSQLGPMERAAMRHGLQEMERAIRAVKPRSADRYCEVFESMIEGVSITELGEREGVTYDAANRLILATRNVARRTRLCGTLSLQVLKLVIEEPNSTRADFLESLDLEALGPIPGVPAKEQEDARQDLLDGAVSFLVRTRRIQMNPNGCCQATDTAEAYLATHSDDFLLAY